MSNKYQKRSRISDKKYREIIHYFCEDLTATQIANLTGLNRKTINGVMNHLRRCIALYCDGISPLSGEIEIDESYFGPHRVRGRRGRGAGKKIIVFGLLKRGDKVYTQVVKNASRDVLKQIIQERITNNSTVYSDGWKAYDGLVDWGYKQHFRVNHGNNEFVSHTNPKNHINGIENFWGLAKVRLAKLRGLRQDHFYLHLKECEFRYNMRHSDMYRELLKILRKERQD